MSIRSRRARRPHALAFALLACLVVAAASASRAEPLARDRVWPSAAAEPDARSRADAPDVCTFATCAPRPADPLGGALAFGGAVLLAGLVARRANARPR